MLGTHTADTNNKIASEQLRHKSRNDSLRIASHLVETMSTFRFSNQRLHFHAPMRRTEEMFIKLQFQFRKSDFLVSFARCSRRAHVFRPFFPVSLSLFLSIVPLLCRALPIFPSPLYLVRRSPAIALLRDYNAPDYYKHL